MTQAATTTQVLGRCSETKGQQGPASAMGVTICAFVRPSSTSPQMALPTSR
jgi:hypothetical protein